ncbi:hypothetical protein [Stackebrandtia soli]|uniref:hypothetical protein n=1 Tax=Stackebrandtia soli TaxID=1892856 RepID=UPI0039ED7C23
MPIYDPAHCPVGPAEQRGAATTSRSYSLSPSRATRSTPLVAAGAAYAATTRPDDDPPRSLGLFKLGHRLIAITYIGDGEARLDLLGAGGAVAAHVGSVAGIDTAVPLLFPMPAQRPWLGDPAVSWFVTRSTVDRYRSTPVPPREPAGEPEVAQRPTDTDCPPTDSEPTPDTGSARSERTEVRP